MAVAVAAAGRAIPNVPTGLVLKLVVVVGAVVLAVLNVCCRGECPAFPSTDSDLLLVLVREPVTVLRARWTCALSTTASSSSASHICCAALFTLAADDEDNDDREDENARDDDEGVVAVADADEAKLEPFANGAAAVAARRSPPRLPPRPPPRLDMP